MSMSGMECDMCSGSENYDSLCDSDDTDADIEYYPSSGKNSSENDFPAESSSINNPVNEAAETNRPEIVGDAVSPNTTENNEDEENEKLLLNIHLISFLKRMLA